MCVRVRVCVCNCLPVHDCRRIENSVIVNAIFITKALTCWWQILFVTPNTCYVTSGSTIEPLFVLSIDVHWLNTGCFCFFLLNPCFEKRAWQTQKGNDWTQHFKHHIFSRHLLKAFMEDYSTVMGKNFWRIWLWTIITHNKQENTCVVHKCLLFSFKNMPALVQSWVVDWVQCTNFKKYIQWK